MEEKKLQNSSLMVLLSLTSFSPILNVFTEALLFNDLYGKISLIVFHSESGLNLFSWCFELQC